jgi:hypothetical protein
MFLLDTVVLSGFRRRTPNPRLQAWISKRRAAELFVSAVTIGEIERGIEKQRRYDPAFAADLESWIEIVEQHYAERILPVDAAVAKRWGQLTARIGHDGPDLMIAATALEHGLHVATRNLRHFAPAGVATVDPFAV